MVNDSQTNQPVLTLRARIELVLCFDFVLLVPSLSAIVQLVPSHPLMNDTNLVPRWQCD